MAGSMGRFAEPALWVLVALDEGPKPIATLLDEVRRLDGRVGHGTLLGALARLERNALVEISPRADGRQTYRSTRRSMESLP